MRGLGYTGVAMVSERRWEKKEGDLGPTAIANSTLHIANVSLRAPGVLDSETGGVC